jgi:transcriptional regulator with XRE-family HTH domain
MVFIRFFLKRQGVENIKEVLNRLKIALNAKSFSEAAAKLGVSENTIDSWRNRKKIPEKHIIALQLKGINTHWLLTGEGEMYKKENNNNINQESTENNNINDSIKNLPTDIQLILEELLQMDKAKRKKILKTILSMEE